ncbi:MAG: hypothetical protein HRT44_02770 [Bdellovibrionales bacterium]|nr:hypothetical protein [Bdellovibrionales bacterium]NQZ18170.1 hypothetical protein [Bdellovibrionales bacterium]
MIARSSDQMSFTPRRDLFTSWDLFETSFFQHQPLTRESHEKNRLDHLAQRFLINGFKVADYNNPACTDLSAQLPESCFINKDIPLEKLTEAMNDSFKMIEIDEDKGYYLDLIKEDHYLHRDHLGIQLRFDGHIGFEQSKIWSITSPHERPIPFTQVKGMFDLIFEMFKSPYLGRQFKNDYYLSLNSRYQGRSPGRTYAVMGPFTERDGDEWLHAYHRAEEFYLARTQRGPFMFKFDEEILTSQFEEVQDDLMKHYNAIDELMEKKDSEFAKYRTDGIPSNYKIRQNREGYELHPLSPGMTQLQREMDTFQTKTEDLYKNEDPSWSKFLPYQ